MPHISAFGPSLNTNNYKITLKKLFGKQTLYSEGDLLILLERIKHFKTA